MSGDIDKLKKFRWEDFEAVFVVAFGSRG